MGSAMKPVWSITTALALIFICACASLDTDPAKGPEAVRSRVVVSVNTDTGVRTASAEQAAEERVSIVSPHDLHAEDDGVEIGSEEHTGRSTFRAFATAEVDKSGQVLVFLNVRRSFPISSTAIAQGAWRLAKPDTAGKVGAADGVAPYQTVEFRVECDGGRQGCTRHVLESITLSKQTVRELIGSGQKKVRFELRGSVGAQVEMDQILAVLDTLGVQDRFD